MTTPAGPQDHPTRFDHLPEPVRLEDTVTGAPVEHPSDPTRWLVLAGLGVLAGGSLGADGD